MSLNQIEDDLKKAAQRDVCHEAYELEEHIKEMKYDIEQLQASARALQIEGVDTVAVDLAVNNLRSAVNDLRNSLKPHCESTTY